MDVKETINELSFMLKKKSIDPKEMESKVNIIIRAYNDLTEKEDSKSEPGTDMLQLQRNLKKKVIDLSTMHEIAKQLSSSLNLDSLIDIFLLTSLGHLLVPVGVIFVLDQKKGKYLFKKAKGIKTDLSSLSFDAEDDFVKFLINKSNPISLVEISKDIRAKHKEMFNKLSCELIVPINIHSKLNGILFLGEKMKGIGFTESNIEFLKALGNFAAIAIENAWLYENLDKKVKEMSTLYEISREINKSSQMDIIIELMMDTITTGFGVEKCSIILYDELKNQYTIYKNHNIKDKQADEYFLLMQEKKVDNPLSTNKPALRMELDGIAENDIYFSVPLIAGNRKVGLINIYQLAEDVILDTEMEQLFSIIASQMAPPIILSTYLSARNVYKENPFDYVFKTLNDLIQKASATSSSFIASRMIIKSSKNTYKDVKTIMEKISSILQDTDIIIHSNLNEIIIIFPATAQHEVESIFNDFIPSIIESEIDYKIVSYPEQTTDSIELLELLYHN